MRISPATVVLEAPSPRGGPIEMLWFHRVEIEIGIGPDRGVATAIFDSIRYAPGLANTKAAEACARAARRVLMPRPERLAGRLVLKQGAVTLAPPLKSDQPIMPAGRAWAEDIWRGQTFERYRLILARYSPANPTAPNPRGLAASPRFGVLAWVVYASPRSPAISGCGNWSVDVFDAITGQGILTESWTPGP